MLGWLLVSAMGCGADCDVTKSNSCAHPDNSDPSVLEIDENGEAMFVREASGNESDMGHIDVTRIDEDHVEALERDPCNLWNRSWGGSPVWEMVNDSGDTPTNLAYGDIPTGWVEPIPSAPLEDGVWYHALWGSCACWSIIWKHGDPSTITRQDGC